MIDVTAWRGKQLEQNRLVTLTIGGAMRTPPGSEAAKDGAPDPMPSPPTGGPIGAEKPASSRPRGRPRKIRPLTSHAVVAGSSR
jgi:hypothetical protein